MISGLVEYLRGEDKKSASIAKERLQIILAHEHGSGRDTPDYMPQLQKELLAVVSKYIKVDDDQIKVQLEKHGKYEVLELNVTLPDDDKA
ncbi:MAG: cell division topological specificity factor MinE [Candidatus Electrothrix sp. AS4_5]|nr:cell division topological specificity factor MinE [Candidatus Electrothrix gigas]